MSAFPGATRARLAWLSVAVLVLATIAGCNLKSGGYNTTSPPKIRMVNTSIDLGAVDVTIGGVNTAAFLGYEVFTPYRSASTGAQPVVVTSSGSTTPLIETTQDFENGDKFQYIVYGRADAPKALTISDNIELPGGGHYKLRFVNVAIEQGALDLYVTSPDVSSLDNVAPTIANIPVGGSSGFLELDAGSLDVRVTLHDSKVILYDSGQLQLSERNAYTLVAYGRGDPALVSVAQLTHDTLGSGQVLASQLGKSRTVNAAVGIPAINTVLDDDKLVASGTAYGTISPYTLITPGTRSVRIDATSAPGTAITTNSLFFPPGGDTTLVVYNALGNQRAVTFQDANLPPLVPGNARVRVINAGSDIGAVNLLVNGTLTVGSLPDGTASLYFELPPASYVASFVDPTTSATLLDIPALVLGAGHTYTLVLVGSAGQFSYVLAQDR
jgi:hypothetical protein